MTKKYDISFGIYDVEAQDWITRDEEYRIEDFTGHITDFNGLSSKIIQIIEDHEEEKAEEELEEDELEKDELEDKEIEKEN